MLKHYIYFPCSPVSVYALINLWLGLTGVSPIDHKSSKSRNCINGIPRRDSLTDIQEI